MDGGNEYAERLPDSKDRRIIRVALTDKGRKLSNDAKRYLFERVAEFLAGRDDASFPVDGWPWPWKTSDLTDYSYAWFDGKVWASYFASDWFDPLKDEPEDIKKHVLDFPDMSPKQNVIFEGPRSGLIVLKVLIRKEDEDNA